MIAQEACSPNGANGRAPGTATERTGSSRGRSLAVDLLAVVAVATSLAIPWIWQDWVACEWIGVAAGLAAVGHLRGWRGESLVLATGALGLGIAFHWSPAVLADAMGTSLPVGLAFTVPIVLWDAIRFSLPFWLVGRAVSDPRDAWLPAALLAVASEAFVTSVFPWKLGYSQLAWPVLVQAVDLFGAEASTFVLFAHAGVLVATCHAIRRWLTGVSGRAWTPTGLAAVVVCVANLAYGAWALAHWSARMAEAPDIDVALVQVDPSHEESVENLQRATREACDRHPLGLDLVCWPECSGGSYEESLPSFTDPERIFAQSRDPQRGLRPLPDPRAPLLFGGKTYRGYPERPRDLYQSAILIDGTERIVGRYHKRHLMPFGEYVPGCSWMPEIRLYFPMDEEIDVGERANALPLADGARLGVLMCYEDMVPAAAAALVADGATVLVSLINGSWFKTPLTLLQHRLLSQMRAIENRRCLLRCAATGETCIVSPLGTILARLPLQTQDVLVAKVPLFEDRTVAGRLGAAFPIACAAALAGAGVARWRRRGAG